MKPPMHYSVLFCMLLSVFLVAAAPCLPPRTCGRTVLQQTRVVGGQNAQTGSWPWQVALFYNGYFVCGGVLISPEWVSSAAHCIFTPNLNSSHFSVVLGDLNLRLAEIGEQNIGISRIIKHPRYSSPSLFNNDISLLKLTRPAMLSKTVQPVCLPAHNKDLAVASLCYVSGWGITTPRGIIATILQHVHLKIISFSDCWMKNKNIAPVTDQMICAANTKPQLTIHTACHGDSGGPLVYKDTDGSWVLHGIVSWGSGTCNTTDAYTVFTRVSRFRDWIDGYVNSKKVIT